MNPQQVAIVGCGRMGAVRAMCCARLGVAVRQVCDTEPAAAARLAAQVDGCAAVTDVAELDWAELDAVFVCTPPAARTPAVLTAVSAGVPFLIEKPVATSLAAAEPMIVALRNQPVRAAVGYHNRYRPGIRRLRATLAEHRAFGLACHWVVGAYQKPWWLVADQSGGPVNEQAGHVVDICRYLLGEVREVVALSRDGSTESARADAVAIALRFDSGACGTFFYSYLAGDKHIALDVFWENGGHAALTGWDFRLPGEPESADRDAPFVTETAAFLGLSGHILSDVDDAVHTQRVVDAVGRALASGAAQRLEEHA